MMVSDIRTWLTSKYETKYYREDWKKSLNINTFRDFTDQDTQHIFVRTNALSQIPHFRHSSKL